MASEDEIAMQKNFFQDIHQKHRELTRRQREYKKIVSLRLKTRSERILERSYIKTINRLKAERNDLRAQIWVANGRSHQTYDQRNLEQIQCHIKCQERMAKQIKDLKTGIENMERQIGRVDKQIYELNRKTVPDTQHQDYVAQARKRVYILENLLEVGIRRQCGLTAENSTLRGELLLMLNNRSHFHGAYTKLVQKLNIDKKYMLDLLEYVCNAMSHAIDLNEKVANAGNKFAKDREQAKLEMQGIMRKFAAAELGNDFMNCKNNVRTLADLQPAEYRRRTAFKRRHVHKITVYNTVLGKLYDFTSTYNVESVIDNYQHHESLYYSYFSLANELSFHIELLEAAVNHLFTNVTKTKIRNHVKLCDQKYNLVDLETELIEFRRRNDELKVQLMGTQKHLEGVFEGIAEIFNLCLADATPLMKLLGNQTHVNLQNAHGFLKTLEMRILNIVRSIYIKEREDEAKRPDQYLLKELRQTKEQPTNLNDIVLTQQCPECAEGETFNMDDGDTEVVSIEETRKALFEKVQQPEMQYRLHSISECRLPRSRLLAAKIK